MTGPAFVTQFVRAAAVLLAQRRVRTAILVFGRHVRLVGQMAPDGLGKPDNDNGWPRAS
jgi:hypothetical protein